MLQDINRCELEDVEGGAVAPFIAAGIIIGVAVGGALVLGYMTGATSDECKKPS